MLTFENIAFFTYMTAARANNVPDADRLGLFEQQSHRCNSLSLSIIFDSSIQHNLTTSAAVAFVSE